STSSAWLALGLVPSMRNCSNRCATFTFKAASMLRMWLSMGPHRCPMRTLSGGEKVCLRIKPIIRERDGERCPDPAYARLARSKPEERPDDRQVDRRIAGKKPSPDPDRLPRRGLRGRRAHEHLLQSARHRRKSVASH